MQTPTPHIGAKLGEIAKTVLMPGDPLRAKFIADNFLEDVFQFNSIRNMFGYTGTYKGKRVSVMGGGMGMPSIGIYSYELFNFYNVDNIIRIGTAGSMNENVKVRDVVIALGASTNSNYAAQYCLPGTFAPIASYELVSAAVKAAKEKNINTVVGNILSSDTFYCADKTATEKWRSMGILAVEMEAAALYMNAAQARKNALCLLTISDSLLTGESLSAEERQLSFTDMMEIALEIAK
ncbi:purine-nucleoside phosphorylase [Clostridium sp. USBA 49]|jgi:purine-nucleoside phosphorylase|uniref:purine-nucleoside phosphorylase n=1 Tax=Clostridium TaxID=1485 RepID=UPI000999440D|nr:MULTISPECIES: purine-nucleoside phosphorylase [Clostridium]SKA80617.1 purine-nucleoside phosphorylase [Clostridium sp. USBA 49]